MDLEGPGRETSSNIQTLYRSRLQREGAPCVTLVCDLDRTTVEFIAEDRKQASLARYFTGLTEAQIVGNKTIALDMWEPYLQAIGAHVPRAAAKIVFDRYHIMTHMGKAVDDVRKREHRALRGRGRDALRLEVPLALCGGENTDEKGPVRIYERGRAGDGNRGEG